MAGKHVFKGTVEVPQAKTNKEAVNLGQVKNIIDRYNKEPVMVATTSELIGTYTANTLTLNSALTELDGVVISDGFDILVKDQADKTQNGIYTIDSTGLVLTRRADFEENKVVLNNTFVNVMQGTVNGDSRWTIVSDGSLVVGSVNITFVKDIDTTSGSVNVVKANITGDGTSKIFNASHNLNLNDFNAYLLIIKDAAGDNVYIDDKPTTSNEANSITLTFSTAPIVGETFKIYILGLE